MTKARDIADFKFENITDTGTTGTKVALEQQHSVALRKVNLDLILQRLAEYYDGANFKSLDAPPSVTLLM